ncbi:MAG: BatD family protein [Gemmatimonadaceae bacterium]|nr:BatD family protein [Gemmatimonadaceae bacterium]
MTPRHSPRVRPLAIATCAALAMSVPTVRAQAPTRIPVQAGATIDRDSVTVGDVVRLTVRVRGPRNATINFPAGVDSLGPVQSLGPPDVRDGADSVEAADRIAVYRLAAWNVGSLRIALGDVLVQTDDDERRVALPLPTLFVRSVLPADTAQRVPKPARDLLEPRVPMPWWWWVAATGVALLLGLGLWWWMRRRRRARGPTGDPFADSELEFERVERLKLIEAGEPGRHAALMTDVARRYLARRFVHASLANTSGELLAALRGVPTLAHERLELLLAPVDRIKFAAAPVAGTDARTLGAEARAVVRAEHEQAQKVAAAVEATTARGAAA